MTLVLGLDTGGTFTDAALLDTASGTVLATAKALTTRADLSIGVGGAIAACLEAWGGPRADIGRVSLSTTLATNAVVEGVGGRVCLVLIGFDDKVMSRAGLEAALGSDPVLAIGGGHKPDGGQQSPLDEDGLRAGLDGVKDQVSSFAVAGHFATRNPAHEAAVREILRAATGLPVTCSHELSDALGGPRRALTTLLNARLISLLERLIKATEAEMERLGLSCPLMVVKGDGSLLRADYARSRPVETVLSGPAASLSGAAFLAAMPDALVADIGGTTTDIARLRGGAVQTSADGAMVGGWRTCVEAAHIRTSGLGGDSEVSVKSRDMRGGVELGPRRAIPLSLLALDHPEIKEVMDAQAGQAIAQATDGRFVVPLMRAGEVPSWLTRSEQKLAQTLIEKGVCALAEAATTQVALGAVDRLVRRGLVMLSCFTPTDAVHVLGRFSAFDASAAEQGAVLLARQKSGAGEPIAEDSTAAARLVIDALTQASALALMDAALADDMAAEGGKGGTGGAGTTGGNGGAGGAEHLISSSSVLRGAVLRRAQGIGSTRGTGTAGGTGSTERGAKSEARTDTRAGAAVQISLSLGVPLIGLGASAGTHYPAIAEVLGADLAVPAHADVAGAVGAAAGAVRQKVVVLVTQPSEGTFRVHLPDGPKDMTDKDAAIAAARQAAQTGATARAAAAGADGQVVVSLSEAVDEVPVGPDKTLFLQAVITAEANAQKE